MHLSKSNSSSLRRREVRGVSCSGPSTRCGCDKTRLSRWGYGRSSGNDRKCGNNRGQLQYTLSAPVNLHYSQLTMSDISTRQFVICKQAKPILQRFIIKQQKQTNNFVQMWLSLSAATPPNTGWGNLFGFYGLSTIQDQGLSLPLI